MRGFARICLIFHGALCASAGTDQAAAQEALDRSVYNALIERGACEEAEILARDHDAEWHRMLAEAQAAGKDVYFQAVPLRSRWLSDIGMAAYPEMMLCKAMQDLDRGRTGLAAAGQPVPYFTGTSLDHYVDMESGRPLELAVLYLFSLGARGYEPALLELARLHQEGVVVARSPDLAFLLLEISGQEDSTLAAAVDAELTPERRQALADVARSDADALLSQLGFDQQGLLDRLGTDRP